MGKKTIAYILLILLLFPAIAHSQSWRQKKYEFKYGIGATNFMGDVAAPSDANKLIWINILHTVGFTGNVALNYHFSERAMLKGDVHIGQLYANDPIDNPDYWYRGIKVNSFFTEISGQYEYMLIKEKPRRTIYRQLGESPFKNFTLPTYAFIGLGGTANFGSYSRIINQGKDVDSESFVNVAPILPIGIGVKFRIDRDTYFNIEAGWRFTLSDGIDNAVGTAENAFGEWYDQYQVVTINLIHKLRENKNGFPRFK